MTCMSVFPPQPHARCLIITLFIHSFIHSYTHAKIGAVKFKRSSPKNQCNSSWVISFTQEGINPQLDTLWGGEKGSHNERALKPRRTRPICAAPNLCGIENILDTLDFLDTLATSDTLRLDTRIVILTMVHSQFCYRSYHIISFIRCNMY